MPFRLVRSASNRTLWKACADRFLGQVAGNPGPRDHQAHLWITHRGLRDSLLERAHERGIEGWLAPPISFFSELPERFRLSGRPVGLLTRRRLVARLAAEHAERLGIGTAENRGVVRGHMMDGLLGELLPEGVFERHHGRTRGRRPQRRPSFSQGDLLPSHGTDSRCTNRKEAADG
jgi:hypothetical protein